MAETIAPAMRFACRGQIALQGVSVAIFNWTRQVRPGLSCSGEGCEFQTYLASDLAKSRVTLRSLPGLAGSVTETGYGGITSGSVSTH